MTVTVESALRQLNERGVSRLEHLEVLLMLSRSPERALDAEQVATSSAIPRAVAEETLPLPGQGPAPEPGRCIVTGKPSAQRVLIARAY